MRLLVAVRLLAAAAGRARLIVAAWLLVVVRLDVALRLDTEAGRRDDVDVPGLLVRLSLRTAGGTMLTCRCSLARRGSSASEPKVGRQDDVGVRGFVSSGRGGWPAGAGGAGRGGRPSGCGRVVALC